MVFEIELSVIIFILIFNIGKSRFNFLSGEKTFWEKSKKLHGNPYHKKKTSQKNILEYFRKY